MTTYQHTLTIGDSEHTALSAALSLMIEHCEGQLAAGAGAPYLAHKQSCIQIIEKLRSASSVMMSTSSFVSPRPLKTD